MANEAISAQGTLIARQPLGVGAFVTIGDLRDIKLPALSRKEIETTSHNELEETFIVGIRRKGPMTFQIGYVPGSATAHHDILETAWLQGSRDVWRVTLPNGRVWLFSGYMTNLSPSAPVDDALVADVTIRPTSILTRT